MNCSPSTAAPSILQVVSYCAQNMEVCLSRALVTSSLPHGQMTEESRGDFAQPGRISFAFLDKSLKHGRFACVFPQKALQNPLKRQSWHRG